METPTVFVVSASAAVCDSVKELVASAGLRAETFSSLQRYLDVIAPERRGCLMFDAQVSDLDDQEREASLAASCAARPGVLITDRGDVPMAVRALKAGAMDVVQKPYRDENLLETIRQAMAADDVARGRKSAPPAT